MLSMQLYTSKTKRIEKECCSERQSQAIRTLVSRYGALTWADEAEVAVEPG